jgi:ethanolamine utilization protein EutN
MFLADVVGTVVSPVQIPILDGEKLLLLRPVDPDGKATGRTRIGIDCVQAGVGDRVLVLDEGSSARQILGDPQGAVKTIVVGVVDYVEARGKLVYGERENRTTEPASFSSNRLRSGHEGS